MKTKLQNRIIRKRRIRAKISGTADCPRLAVFKSNRFISVQLIDDGVAKTLAAASDMKIQKLPAGQAGKVARAEQVGREIAKLALEKKIKQVVFDRGGYKYVGRIKALAEGARAGGLQF